MQHVSLKDLKHELSEWIVILHLFLFTCHLLGKDHHDLQRHFSFVGLALGWIDLLKNAPDQLEAWIYQRLHLKNPTDKRHLAVPEHLLLV